VRKSIDHEMGLSEARAHRFDQQLSALKGELTSAVSDRDARAGEVSQRRAELVRLDEELESNVRACQEIRTVARVHRNKVSRAREESLAHLQELRAQCQAQLNDLRREIADRERAARDQRQALGVQSKRKVQEVERVQNPTNWLSERAVLVSKVKKATEELGMLEKRVRGATRASTRVANERVDLGFDSEDVKVAIVREIGELQNARDVFLAHTLESELAVQEELKKKLRDSERTQVEIAEFQKGVLELLGQQKANAKMESRLRVLKSELADLRANI
jgi:chromosome segregation ATPase